MFCYDENGPNCTYCVIGEFTSDDPQTWVYGLPRYDCIHPLEGDIPIDPDEICNCPESYKKKKGINEEEHRALYKPMNQDIRRNGREK